jgi:hypothetical protein
MINEIKKSIENIYEEILFKDNFVNRNSGEVKIDKTRKLATYPYIGSKYGRAKKILIVGFDIGNDETIGQIQSLEIRNRIETNDLRNVNPHIGGKYFTALYFLKEDLNLNHFWEDSKTSKYGKTFNTILRKIPNLPIENPLSYISMTNFYKYVTIGRENSRRGDFDRIFIDREREIKLFLSEVDVLKPEIIFFQSKGFQNLEAKIKEILLEMGIKLYFAYHPSDYSQIGGNIPENYFSKRIFEILK